MSSLSRYQKIPVNNAALVEARLKSLQGANRLGIHSFEEDDKANIFYPHKTREILAANEGMSTADVLRSPRPALFSLSLIPPSGKAITPFEYHRVGYLFDLSVGEKKSPALVVRAFHNNGNTGERHFDKNLHFGMHYELKGLEPLYHGHYAGSFKCAVADDASLSEKQLDVLGAYYARRETPAESSTHNEIVAAVQKDHIAAIVVSYDPEYGNAALTRLKGALAGLAHLEQAVNLPVVMYTKRGPDRGKITYLAQGKEQYTQLAIDALKELKKEHKTQLVMLKGWQPECRYFLGVDITKPIDKQLDGRGHG